MPKRIIRSVIILLVLVCTAFGSRLRANTSPRPLRKSELLALIAGGALPENVIAQINSQGLRFRPDDSFRPLLEVAGANSGVLHALHSAKDADAPLDDQADREVLQHRSTDGILINA